MKKRLPKLRTDKEAEKFIERDLTEYLHADNFQRVTFEFQNKDKTVSLRLSRDLLESIKKLSKRRKMPYQRFIREALEFAVKSSTR